MISHDCGLRGGSAGANCLFQWPSSIISTQMIDLLRTSYVNSKSQAFRLLSDFKEAMVLSNIDFKALVPTKITHSNLSILLSP